MTVNSTIRSYVKLLTLHSFPTRRSSDLRQGVPGGRAGRGGRDGKTVVAAVTIPYIPPPLSPAARTFVAAAAAVLALLGAPAAAQPADAPTAERGDASQRIKEIRVEGNRRVEAEAVRRALKQKKGQPFDPTKTPDDIKALWALSYFADVQLLVQRDADGIVYVVRVEERPSIHDVQIVGNEELGK